MAVQNARISTKDLDARLLAVEEKLSAIVEQLSRLERAAQEHAAPEHPEHPEQESHEQRAPQPVSAPRRKPGRTKHA